MPLSIAGLPASGRKLLLVVLVKFGLAFKLEVEKAGVAPAPKKRLFVPLNRVLREFGAKYDSPVSE